MRRSTKRMLTTHTGSLPRSASLAKKLILASRGEPIESSDLSQDIRRAVAEIVGKQVATGLDVINDGEQGKVDFHSYRQKRLAGFERLDARVAGPTYTFSVMEANDFPEFYNHWLSGGTIRTHSTPAPAEVLCCVDKVTWRDFSSVLTEIENLKAATAKMTDTDVFMSAISPATYAPPNHFYNTEDEYFHDLAVAMSREYKAIVDAGFILQIDSPDLGNTWRKRDLSIEELRRHTARCVEVINYAVRDLPSDRMRVHVCWGADEAPHHRDVPLKDIIDILLGLRPAGMTIAGANGRHAHEWKVWQDVKLPDGKIIVPGVIDSTTNIIEHPEAVAERICQYASVLGSENVIAGVDCGFDTVADMGQVDPKVCWAKLRSLADGAAIASKEIYV